jgi:tripartite-type tricarboxylate transporter receptor subunit TctC
MRRAVTFRSASFGLCVALVLAGILSARAGDYPTRPVRWIVPYTPGGATDVTARLIGQRLAERLGQPFFIENRPGAGANIGTEAVINSPPDGYTLLLTSTANAINATLYRKLPFNFLQDIALVAGIERIPLVMEVNPSVPATTVGEFIAYAKNNPGKISYASSGTGTSLHLTGELFKAMTGVDIIHVPYRGSAPALADLISGQVQLMFDNVSSSVEHIRAGKVRALAVTSLDRSEQLPDIPTVNDTVPGFDSSSVYGVGVPKGTPVAIIEELNREINDAIADPLIKTRLRALGVVPIPGSPKEFGRLMTAETEKWAKVVRFSGVSED